MSNEDRDCVRLLDRNRRARKLREERRANEERRARARNDEANKKAKHRREREAYRLGAGILFAGFGVLATMMVIAFFGEKNAWLAASMAILAAVCAEAGAWADRESREDC